jgi:hypothetical protein
MESPDEQRTANKWRVGHGAVFLTMMLLGLAIVAFATSNDCELVKPFTVAPASQKLTAE